MRLRFNRAFLLLVMLIFLPFFVGAQASISLDEAVQRGAAYLQNRFPKGTRAAALPGKSENSEIADSANTKLCTALVNGGWFVMVATDEAAQKNIAREMERHLNLEVSQETAQAKHGALISRRFGLKAPSSLVSGLPKTSAQKRHGLPSRQQKALVFLFKGMFRRQGKGRLSLTDCGAVCKLLTPPLIWTKTSKQATSLRLLSTENNYPPLPLPTPPSYGPK